MSTSRRPMHERRAEIADAILRLAGARGVAALTMASIAAEVGVTSGALFRHFASRDEMLAEAAHRAESLLSAGFPPPGLSPLERLERLVLARIETVQEHPGLVGLMLSDQFVLALPSGAAATLRGVVARTRRFVVDALREGAEAGTVRGDIPPEDLAPIVLGTIQIAATRGAGALIATGKSGIDARQRLWTTLATLLAPPPRDATPGPSTTRRKERHDRRPHRTRR